MLKALVGQIMSSLRTKNAPLPPANLLLDRRWKEHDYLLHQYRLGILKGDGPAKPVYNEYGPITTTERQSKSALPKPSERAKTAHQRPKTSKLASTNKIPPILPQAQRWIKSSTRPLRSEYSVEAHQQHFRQHQYYLNHILKRRAPVAGSPKRRQRSPKRKSPRKSPVAEEDQKDSSYSDEFDSSSSEDIAPSAVTTGSPSPVLTPRDNEKRVFMEDNDDMHPLTGRPASARPKSRIVSAPPRKLKRLQSLENFVPPSHIIKIVRDAENLTDSESSDSDVKPAVVLRDGKPGKYIFKSADYFLDLGSTSSSEEGEEDGDDRTERRKRRRKNRAGKSSEHKLDEKFVEKFSNLREDTPADFDAKRGDGEDSDFDEFGRRKVRERPSSSMYSSLPPLAPDPILDNGDVNLCKTRLMKDTVHIKEHLSRETGPDVESIVDIILRNNNDNRRWLRKMYRDEYLQSLLTDLRKILPVDIASFVSYMMIPTCEYDAICLWDSLKGLHKDTEVVSEILCTRSNYEIQDIKSAYMLRFKEDLLDHIEDETTGVYQRFMMRLALGQRQEDDEFDKEQAGLDARAIVALLDTKGELLERKLTDIFCSRSIEMLRCLLTEFVKIKAKSLMSELVRVLTGNFLKSIATIIAFIQNPPNFFVERLHSTHFGGVDDDKTLLRIMISRSDKDLVMIKELFRIRYDMDLFDYVTEVCHGSLRSLAMRFIAGPLQDDERERLNIPKLVSQFDGVEAIERLQLTDCIKSIMRKTKVVSTLMKALFAKRERTRIAEEEKAASSSSSDFELDPEQGSDVEEEAKRAVQESDEDSSKKAHRELRDGLKNISFADQVEVEGSDSKGGKSVFADVSFANASRGILKRTEDAQPVVDGEGEADMDRERQEINEELGIDSIQGPKMTQLSGPVLDPTFLGRRDPNFTTRVPFLKKGKRKIFKGTVKGVSMEDFNALKDAQAIGRAMLQKNRNVDGILRFLVTRNNAQRQLIIREFFRRYRRDLVDDLRVLAPHHEQVILAMLLSSEIFDAASLYGALNSPVSIAAQEDVLIEILCTRPNDEVSVIRRSFSGIFDMDLTEEINKISKGWFKKLILSIAACQREEGDLVDEELARKDAAALFEAHIKRTKDFNVYIDIFTTRSFAHIEAVCEYYAKMTHTDILEVLDEDLHAQFLEGVTSIICSVRDAPVYFCERIYQSVALEPPDYTMLTRCVISRAEIDLQVIKATFRRTYGRSLYNMVAQDCEFKSKQIVLDFIKKT